MNYVLFFCPPQIVVITRLVIGEKLSD